MVTYKILVNIVYKYLYINFIKINKSNELQVNTKPQQTKQNYQQTNISATNAQNKMKTI